MDLLSLSDVQDLLQGPAGPCLSLYMPVHPRTHDTEQDPIRFRNLLRDAEERLLARGLRAPDIREMLASAEALLQDPLFWAQGGEGLAFFAAPGYSRHYRLPLQLPELIAVSSRFHIKPLMPMLSSDGRYYILALSQKQVRLLEATRHTVEELEAERTLPALAEALQYDHYERQQQYHTHASAGQGQGPAGFHGTDLNDEAKERMVRWFRRIDAGLVDTLSGERAPLVLAGVDYLFPLYREANTYGHLLEAGVPGNPEVLSPRALHAAAWPLVEPIFDAGRRSAAERYAALAGTGRTADDLATAVPAADHGRVDALFVALGAQVWGRYDPSAVEPLAVHVDPAPADGDLLDLAAMLTLRNGGEVFVVPPAEVPGGGLLAAVLRY